MSPEAEGTGSSIRGFAILGGIAIAGVAAFQMFFGHEDCFRCTWPGATTVMLSKVSNQIDLFNLNHGRYPSQLADLIRQPSYVNSKDWPRDGYLKKEDEIRDAWNHPYLYCQPGLEGRPFNLGSYGKDGRPGGEDSDEDLWNHDRGSR